ncbi:hypothetical protein GCM10023196_008160 [Actinoallomurus vinaceus]|uniref:Uncharacterized protein n=1 Tax=Actinoallomurus vinaceus TaxID=1080074 RepID=A0ABP8U0S7_9ACTN
MVTHCYTGEQVGACDSPEPDDSQDPENTRNAPVALREPTGSRVISDPVGLLASELVACRSGS